MEPRLRTMVPEQDRAYREARSERLENSRPRAWGDRARRLEEQAKQHSQELEQELETLAVEQRIAESSLLSRFGIQSVPQRDKVRQTKIQQAQIRETLANTWKKVEHAFTQEFTDTVFTIQALPPSARKTQLKRCFVSLLQANQVRSLTQVVFGKKPEDLSFEDIYQAVSTDEKPLYASDLIQHAFNEHQRRVQEQSRQAEALVEQYKREFLADLQKAMDSGRFPKVPNSTLQQRLSLIKGKVHDALNDPKRFILGTHADDGSIGISSLLLNSGDLPAIRSTLYHEFLHEISGKSIQVTLGENGKTSFSNRKIGLAIHHLHAPNRFTLLNEAVTERLTRQLIRDYHPDESERDTTDSYHEEQMVLEALLKHGVSKQSILEAYIENIRVDIPPEQRGAAFGRLMREIRARYGAERFAEVSAGFELKDAVTSILSSTNTMSGGELTELLRRGREPSHLLIQPIRLAIGKGKAAVFRKTLYFIHQAAPTGKTEEDARKNAQDLAIIRSIIKQAEQQSGFRVSCSIGEPAPASSLLAQTETQNK